MSDTKTVTSQDDATTTHLSTAWIVGITALVLLLLIGGITVALVRHQLVKHQEAAAQVVADKVIADMGKQDTAAIIKLGDASFQKKNAAAELSQKLTFQANTASPIKFSELFGDSKPQIDRRIIANNSNGQHTSFIYVYQKLKVPFFVRLDLTKSPGSSQWKLSALSASSTESKLQ